ncbi:MAG: hypothetical protein ACOYMN_13915 [Roseimicrobium sp.]
MIDAYNWAALFGEIFVDCCEAYEEGENDYNTWFEAEDLAFLESIGCKPRELFDFVEDCVNAEGGEPTPETALLVAAVRRDCFLIEQDGVASTRVVAPAALPAKTEALDGIVWLPRIIAKAEAKLRGEMDPEIMFGCGGDRAFLSEHKIHLADFLRAIWAAKGDTQRIVHFVKTGKWA